MNRRTFLTGTTAAALPLLGGCVARAPGASRDDSSANSSNESEGGAAVETESRVVTEDPPSGTESTVVTDDPPSMPDSKGPVRGQSDADVETEGVEDDENVEYLPEEDAVRYVSAWRTTNPTELEEPPEREPVYDTVPFERWGKTNCVTAAARAAADHAAAELGVAELGSGVSFGIDGRDRAAFVSISTLYDREGDVISEPSVEFDALVAATPATVHATYRLEDQEYALEAPIYVQHDVVQQA